MQRLIFTLSPKTAFGTPLAGDTLFGQCCWAIRHLFGEEKLTELLTGYLENKPFMVISDAMPQGFLPRPTLPSELLGFDNSNTKQRKAQKSKKWFSESVLKKPVPEWANDAKTESEMLTQMGLSGRYLICDKPQDHNSLNRLSGTTGKGEGFAPFQRETFWYHPEIKLNLIVELDTQRLTQEELEQVFEWVGLHGYGKEASAGLGKFEIIAINEATIKTVENPNAWLTLAPCAPQGLAWDSAHCYYQVLTRFGRHGDLAVHKSGGAFKNPVLLANTGAILTPTQKQQNNNGFIGQGITGVSQTISKTVHQGYAPVYAICLEMK
jgi:CRISPR-associated protein Csm4